jgi:miniconductance mechanosensitive channel
MSELRQWFHSLGLDASLASLATLGAAVLLAALVYLLARWILVSWVSRLVRRSRIRWDDAIFRHRLLHRALLYLPAIVVQLSAPAALGAEAHLQILRRVVYVYVLVVTALVFDAALNVATAVYERYEFSRRRPLRGVVQILKVIVWIVVAILAVSELIRRDPTYLLGGMTAMTAVILLVFRDTILGFVAGIHLSANRMIHVGDWIEMPKYDADGYVTEVNLTAVKVQNWDKTITTIPTYALISESFRNWRGMLESPGRRIKRSIFIDMTSVRFCNAEMLERYRRIRYIREYLKNKEEEIAEHNRGLGDDGDELLDGRHLTNLGTFRAYLAAYLRNHPKIHQEMTFLVRHLQPTPQGLPIEIYVFCRDQAWANYEGVQADIFDHLLAILPEFDLRVFQSPSGLDVQRLAGRRNG